MLADYSIYSPTQLANETAGTSFHSVLVFDPRLYLSWWPEQNFSDYKTSLVGRYTRAVTLTAWDQAKGAGFTMTAAPNTRRGIETEPYDTSELLVELEEHGHAPRWFAVRGCVTSESKIAKQATDGRLCDRTHGCRLLVLCAEPGGKSFPSYIVYTCQRLIDLSVTTGADSTTTELTDGALVSKNDEFCTQNEELCIFKKQGILHLK